MNTASTVNLLRLQLSKLTGKGFSIQKSKTLNEYLGGSEPYLMSTGTDYALDFFTIGNNGYEDGKGDGSPPISSVPPRNPLLGVLYRHLPFVINKESQGVVVDTNLYGLKVRVVANGIPYICYFAKRIDSVSEETIARKSVFHGDIVSNTDIVMDSIRPQGLFTGSDKVTVSRNIICRLVDADIEAAKKYAEVVMGNPDYGLIRELGIVGGIQHSISGDMSNLWLASSMNIGNLSGILTPATISVSLGRSATMVRQ